MSGATTTRRSFKRNLEHKTDLSAVKNSAASQE